VKSTARVNAGHSWTLRTPGNEYAIIAAVERVMWKRPRDIARESGLFQPIVLQVLHACIPAFVERPSVPDYRPLRMKFCEWLRHQHTADELSVHNIMWTDETCFT
jgi:hypothetical protein